jgi:hypothetical protein
MWIFSTTHSRQENTRGQRRCASHLKKAFGLRKLGEVSADDTDLYLRLRLQERVRIKTSAGFMEHDKLKPATVHQELHVLRRMPNVAVRKRLLPYNPSVGVEFPVAVKGLFRRSSGLSSRLRATCKTSSGSSLKRAFGSTRS